MLISLSNSYIDKTNYIKKKKDYKKIHTLTELLFMAFKTDVPSFVIGLFS